MVPNSNFASCLTFSLFKSHSMLLRFQQLKLKPTKFVLFSTWRPIKDSYFPHYFTLGKQQQQQQLLHDSKANFKSLSFCWIVITTSALNPWTITIVLVTFHAVFHHHTLCIFWNSTHHFGLIKNNFPHYTASSSLLCFDSLTVKFTATKKKTIKITKQQSSLQLTIPRLPAFFQCIKTSQSQSLQSLSQGLLNFATLLTT